MIRKQLLPFWWQLFYLVGIIILDPFQEVPHGDLDIKIPLK